MSKKLSTGITSRQHKIDGRLVTQYRGRIQDPSRRTPKGTVSTKSSRYFDRMADAKAWLDDQRKLLAQYGSLNVDKAITVGEATLEWITEARAYGINGRSPIEDATWQRYKSTLDNVINGTIDLVRIADLRPAMVKRWVYDLAEVQTRDCAHRALALLKMVLDDQIAKERVLMNAAASVNISKRGADDEDSKVVTEFMSKDDVKRVLAAADALYAGTDDLPLLKGATEHHRGLRRRAWARWRPLIYLLVLTGVRIGEAAGLQWKHIDLKKGVIHVCQARKRNGTIGKPKTRAGDRHVTIEAELVSILLEWKRSRNVGPNQFVFASEGSPFRPENFARRAWEPMMLLAGLVDAEGHPLWSRHDCRHFHASFLILEGYPESQVAERLGHADVNVTRKVYLHLFKEMAGHSNRIGANLEKLILGHA